ncbi:TetR/AcrR family transcriptional regulator [Arthrobacter sp. SLBN-53]|uniref:TetR/AcrR family transcriptional regulator n=1 Tax=Arthrobacter sp. SLBN-53 TaxID=2768412 RepID=UPI0011695252|nr:TetR/AcrR family transcriptional regulator [Arthrobacter sp. SLBN-53]TQK29906.1 TetR family transcriptional regulator [Arthrobacter sp. SLBN-53]
MVSRPQSHYRRGHARRAVLLRAAVDEIAESGLEGVTHRSIAARAELPVSTTSYFFGSLDELIGAAVQHIAEDVVSSIEGLTDDLASTDLDLADFADRLLDILSNVRARQVVVQFESYLATSRRPELIEPVRAIMVALETAAADALAAIGISESPAAARQFVALVDGFALHRVAWPRAGEDEEFLRDALWRLLNSYLAEARSDLTD